jgi:hypothetical protein
MTIFTGSEILPDFELKVLFFYIHIQCGFVEIIRQTEPNLFLNALMSYIMGPVVDLNETAVSEINKIDFKFVQIVLDKDESIDFFATKIIDKHT